MLMDAFKDGSSESRRLQGHRERRKITSYIACMEQHQPLKAVPDGELLDRLAQLTHTSRRTESELIEHIAEVDERKLYAPKGCSSMFSYCIEVLHLSEPEA